MKEDDLVRLMDAYMGCEGFYMKPKIEEDGRTEDAGQGKVRYISTIYGQSLILYPCD